jgi:small GTP-binding protein
MNADYDYLMKIVVAGNSGCGKSSLLQQYVDKTFNASFVATIGVDFKIKQLSLNSGKTAKLQLWDTAGQERFRTIVASYWRGADGVAFVFDVTDMASFESVKQWAEEVERHASSKVQKILVGNKVDLVEKRVVTKEMGEQLAKSMGIKYIETSAKTMANVNESFQLAAEIIAANYQTTHGIGSTQLQQYPVVPKSQKVKADAWVCC